MASLKSVCYKIPARVNIIYWSNCETTEARIFQTALVSTTRWLAWADNFGRSDNEPTHARGHSGNECFGALVSILVMSCLDTAIELLWLAGHMYWKCPLFDIIISSANSRSFVKIWDCGIHFSSRALLEERRGLFNWAVVIPCPWVCLSLLRECVANFGHRCL